MEGWVSYNRQARVRRADLSDMERRKVWVRAGGRCTLCKRYLLEGGLTWQEVPLGDGAHIVGQKRSADSPRGLDPLPEDVRGTADNVLLACEICHKEIDHKRAVGVMTVEELRRRKREHEDMIRHLTGLLPDQRTVVLRMLGNVRGKAIELHQDTAAMTVIRSGERFPAFSLSYSRHGVEIDLRALPGEADGTPGYYAAACAVIDEILAHKLAEGVVGDHVSHLSVFAFARLPLLVYLGAGLDDTVQAEIYQRHRARETWQWAQDGPDVTFQVEGPGTIAADREGVLVLNLSGTIQHGELPGLVAPLPTWRITPAAITPHADILTRRTALDAFELTVRSLFSEIEAAAKSIDILHVFPALPVAAAVMLGRARDPQVHPRLLIYDRTACGYRPVLEVS
jgi:hypothetical protein